jgi:microcystin-dependent protein
MANLQDITNRSEVGTIKPWGKATAPVGYVLCDGAAISRTTYVDLFGIISTTYGVENGSTTFNVPNLQGKTPQGYDGNTYNLAATGGANTVTVAVTNNQAVSSVTNTVTNNQAVTVTGSISNTSLTTAQLASHKHSIITQLVQSGIPGPGFSGSYRTIQNASGIDNASENTSDAVINNEGSGTGHDHAHTLAGTLTGTVAVTSTGAALSGTVTAAGNNTFSPYVVVNYIIKH